MNGLPEKTRLIDTAAALAAAAAAALAAPAPVTTPPQGIKSRSGPP
jgi:hypothetical protein